MGSSIRGVRRRLFARRSAGLSLEEHMKQGRLVLGHRSYGNFSIPRYRGDAAVVRIGRFCSIGDDVTFLPGGNHRTDWVTTFPVRIRFDLPGGGEDGHPTSRGDIVVGHDVWIARGATILSGVTIGNGAVIGAHAVVTRDVDDYAVVAGNPAVATRHRFEPEVIAALNRIAWWDWPDDVVAARVDELCTTDIEGFVARHDPARHAAPDEGPAGTVTG